MTLRWQIRKFWFWECWLIKIVLGNIMWLGSRDLTKINFLLVPATFLMSLGLINSKPANQAIHPNISLQFGSRTAIFKYSNAFTDPTVQTTSIIAQVPSIAIIYWTLQQLLIQTIKYSTVNLAIYWFSDKIKLVRVYLI